VIGRLLDRLEAAMESAIDALVTRVIESWDEPARECPSCGERA
jgi:hypothetical protein